MGREAECDCIWNGAASRVKALLEPPELILRGAIRRRLPFAELQQARADGTLLSFRFQDEPVSLHLGSAMAAKWAQSILRPPPTLAKKLGISESARVRLIGSIDDDALRKALSEAAEISSRNSDLIIARVNTPAELSRALRSAAARLARGVPIWFIYRKGPGHALSESDVRFAGLAAGIVDTKIAAVSPALTALRFVKRRSPKAT